jgi:hypothetical protein
VPVLLPLVPVVVMVVVLLPVTPLVVVPATVPVVPPAAVLVHVLLVVAPPVVAPLVVVPLAVVPPVLVPPVLVPPVVVPLVGVPVVVVLPGGVVLVFVVAVAGSVGEGAVCALAAPAARLSMVAAHSTQVIVRRMPQRTAVCATTRWPAVPSGPRTPHAGGSQGPSVSSVALT